MEVKLLSSQYYVDDILIAGKTDERISEVKAAIADHFKVKTWVNCIIIF